MPFSEKKAVEDRATVEDVQRQNRLIVRLLAAVMCLFALYVGYQVFVVNPTSADNKAALCASKNLATQQLGNAEEFLKDHPEGAFGFKPKEIQVQIAQEAAAVKAYEPLSC